MSNVPLSPRGSSVATVIVGELCFETTLASFSSIPDDGLRAVPFLRKRKDHYGTLNRVNFNQWRIDCKQKRHGGATSDDDNDKSFIQLLKDDDGATNVNLVATDRPRL